jgi:TonB family protein
MFETSVVQARALPSRGKYTLLTMSLIAHSAVIVGAVAIGIASTRFPTTAPDEFASPPYLLPVTIPPPLGNPNAGGPKPAQTQQVKPAPLPTQPVAPTTVPDAITPAQSQATGSDVTDGPATGEPGPIGVPWGVQGSIGDIDAPPTTGPQTPVENKIYTVGEVKAPVILARIEPVYPPALARAGVKGKVAVHCVIDKNGRVRDPQVVFATMPAFADSVLRAMKEWRYQPASLNGQAVDCYLDLTVDFGIVR